MNVVGGTPVISCYQNDGLGTVNQQSNMTSTGIGTQDNLYQTVGAINSGGYISATSRSTGATQPMLLLTNTAAGTGGVAMEAYKNKPSAGVAGDEVFRLSMFGKNSSNFKDEYGRITCNIRDPSGPTAGADGQLLFAVPVGDAMTTFIDLNGNSNQINTFKNINMAAGTAISFSNSTSQTTAYTGFQPISTTTYTNPSITFNTFGQITAVSNGTPVGALTSLTLISPANVGPDSTSIDVVAPTVLPAGTYLLLGNVAIRTVAGSGVLNAIYLNILKDYAVDTQTLVTGNSSYIVSCVPPTVPFTSTGTTVLSINAQCQCQPAQNFTYSLTSTQSRLFALRIA